MDREDEAWLRPGLPGRLDALRARGVTALMLAAWRGHVEMIRLLCEFGADVNQLEYASRTALHLAARQGHLDAAAALIEAGADVNGGKAHTPLMDAVDTRGVKKTSRQVKQMAALLLSNGADPSIAAHGASAAQLVAESGFPQYERDALTAMLKQAPNDAG